MNSKNYLYLGAIVIILMAILIYMKTSNNPKPTPTISTTEEATNSADISKTIELVIKDKKVISGPETISVKKGDKVTIKISSNEDEELHIHGYDKSVDLVKNQPAKIEFTADMTGHFPYELEKSKTEIGALEVTP